MIVKTVAFLKTMKSMNLKIMKNCKKLILWIFGIFQLKNNNNKFFLKIQIIIENYKISKNTLQKISK